MQAAEEIEAMKRSRSYIYRRCSREEMQPFEQLLECYGYSRLTARLHPLCRVESQGSSLGYFLARHRVAARHAPYVAGVHVAMLRRGRSRHILPTLGLISLAHRYGLRPRHYVVVKQSAAVLFIYGRDVAEDSIVRIQRGGGPCKGLPLVVLDEFWEPIGYGTPAKRADELLIRNVLDAGWYLRSGV